MQLTLEDGDHIKVQSNSGEWLHLIVSEEVSLKARRPQ